MKFRTKIRFKNGRKEPEPDAVISVNKRRWQTKIRKVISKDVERLETQLFLIVSGRYLASQNPRIETRMMQWSKWHISNSSAQKKHILDRKKTPEAKKKRSQMQSPGIEVTSPGIGKTFRSIERILRKHLNLFPELKRDNNIKY